MYNRNMFRASFIWFLIIVVAGFSLSVKVAEAGFWSTLWTVIAAVVTVALVILTGGAALGLLGLNLMTGAVSLGGVGAALITTGVACGSGLICGGSTENPIAIISSGAGSCSSDNRMRFYDTEPGATNPDDQIALYRFSTKLDKNDEFLNYKLATWMSGVRGSTVQRDVGPGFYNAGASASGRNYLETDSGSYANYHTTTTDGVAPLRTMRYGDVCSASGVCQLLDQSAPERSYVIYAAKVLRNYPHVLPLGKHTGSAALVPLNHKFLSAKEGAPATFPYFNYSAYEDCKDDNGSSACRRVAGQWYKPGTVYAGPFRVGKVSPATCPAPTVPVAVVNVTQTECASVTLSITATNADTYDILRDDAVIASGIAADEFEYRDSGLSPMTTYRYRVHPRKGSEVGDSNEVMVQTGSCTVTPSAQVSLRDAQCAALTLSVVTERAATYDMLRNGAVIAAGVPASQTTYRDSPLARGTDYSYKVVARGSSGQSAESNTLTSRTACAPSCA
ncbi:MAG: hypothetical protein HYZ07_00250, partial [Candidatus Harrisonbacteria bacterium]|nr:hypothetical protein [Candidatus Harrisonbacteria bacterium]